MHMSNIDEETTLGKKKETKALSDKNRDSSVDADASHETDSPETRRNRIIFRGVFTKINKLCDNIVEEMDKDERNPLKLSIQGILPPFVEKSQDGNLLTRKLVAVFYVLISVVEGEASEGKRGDIDISTLDEEDLQNYLVVDGEDILTLKKTLGVLLDVSDEFLGELRLSKDATTLEHQALNGSMYKPWLKNALIQAIEYLVVRASANLES